MISNSFPWQILLDWYTLKGNCDFPWRKYNSLSLSERLYRVWISEILLQQTQAQRVIPYFERIIQQFPDIQALAKSDYDTFFPYYKGMGYYSRARNILKTASIIHTDFEGVFPKEHTKLTSLPGVGEYTARAIRAFGYGESVLAWDTNLEKIFSRFFFGSKEIKLSKKDKDIIEQDFRDFVLSQSNTSTYVRNINNALMDFGREIDKKTSQEIDWNNYPITSGKWYETRGNEEKNIRKNTSTFPTPDAKIIAIVHENHKSYFSENQTKYTPFIVSPAETQNIRAYIKSYFIAKYGLEVSVRPAHKKWLSTQGEPFLAVNIQVQTGNHTFHTFSKGEAREELKKIYTL